MKRNVLWCLIGLLLLIYPLELDSEALDVLKENELYMAFLSLPDGESTLIQTGNEKNILINTGSPKSEEKLLSILEEFELPAIDTLILTKQSIDYCGNTKRLTKRYHVANVIYTGKLSEACKNQVSPKIASTWKRSELHEITKNLQIRVLDAEPTGEMSLGIIYGQNSVLYMSNSTVEDEKQIGEYPLEPQIIKIGDYGQGNSPSEAFLETIDPHISIVFACEECKTNEGLIERLNESWIDVYPLKRIGTTIVKMDLENYDIVT
ncbi:ComEC/Rec2 family competence protein [Radiobacillus deserti]|uniref:MBL fold metallo-hydrolase n=1 Tax=Radiobacillus deserti TaxID=2594883 RepID=A0A516KGC0_9BACI|nr:hypothetical protein [Radiobacillus deserti]QDP40434.1 hypothetical protein FN924_09715 [Radiobacillus deserti]